MYNTMEDEMIIISTFSMSYEVLTRFWALLNKKIDMNFTHCSLHDSLCSSMELILYKDNVYFIFVYWHNTTLGLGFIFERPFINDISIEL